MVQQINPCGNWSCSNNRKQPHTTHSYTLPAVSEWLTESLVHGPNPFVVYAGHYLICSKGATGDAPDCSCNRCMPSVLSSIRKETIPQSNHQQSTVLYNSCIPSIQSSTVHPVVAVTHKEAAAEYAVGALSLDKDYTEQTRDWETNSILLHATCAWLACMLSSISIARGISSIPSPVLPP